MSAKALAKREPSDVDYRVQVAYTVPVEVIVDPRKGTVDRVVVIDEEVALEHEEGARKESLLHPVQMRSRGGRPRSPRQASGLDPTPVELTASHYPGAAASAVMGGVAEDPYTWRAAHWGCIRPADPESVHREDSVEWVLAYRFSTVWSPPEGVAATLASRFPTISVELSFFQPARGFAGVVSFDGGEEVCRTECEEPEGVREILEHEFGAERAAELLDPVD